MGESCRVKTPKINFKIVFFGLIILILGRYLYSGELFGFQFFCPFKELTGFDCPGCGSQRALHYLLHLDIKKAFLLNPILVILIPYVLLFFLFRIKSIQLRFKKINSVFFGFKTIVVILAFILIFGLLRNTSFYQLLLSRS